MTQWRIRIIVPDDPGGYQALEDALAAVQASRMRRVPVGAAQAGTAGEITVELGEDSALPDLLHALHEISPRVFISRVSPDQTAVPA